MSNKKFPETKMVSDSGVPVNDGYPQSAFNDDYWMYRGTNGEARIEKSAGSAIAYFKKMFEFIGTNDFSILDVGAGAGNFVNQFRKAGYRSEGCEYSESGKRLAKERFKIDLSYCDLKDKLPYNTDEFDWSLCAGVLSMIPRKDMKNAMSEILRVTKYGLLVNVGTLIGPVNLQLRLGNWHHITAMSSVEYYKLITEECGGYDWTSILPPQKAKYGIGVVNEYAGLVSKSRWPF